MTVRDPNFRRIMFVEVEGTCALLVDRAASGHYTLPFLDVVLTVTVVPVMLLECSHVEA